MSAYRAALESIRRVTAELARGDLLPDERRALLLEISAAMALLEASVDRRRLSTSALAARVSALEEKLADRAPAARRTAICARLGISRATYYRLKRSVSPT